MIQPGPQPQPPVACVTRRQRDDRGGVLFSAWRLAAPCCWGLRTLTCAGHGAEHEEGAVKVIVTLGLTEMHDNNNTAIVRHPATCSGLVADLHCQRGMASTKSGRRQCDLESGGEPSTDGLMPVPIVRSPGGADVFGAGLAGAILLLSILGDRTANGDGGARKLPLLQNSHRNDIAS